MCGAGPIVNRTIPKQKNGRSMKILLFGKNGQLGWELQRSLAPLGDIVALGRDSSDLCGDLSRAKDIVDTVRTVRPHVIVNAAAYTAVDMAEDEPDLAYAINAEAVGVLAQEASRIGSWIIHYSTDYVFNGVGERPWKENDTPAPLNVYGKTKLRGEQFVLSNCAKHLLFRTGWLYAARGANFAKAILRQARQQEHMAVVSDQFGTPTGADLVADVTALAIRHVWHHPEDAGLYHLVAAGMASRHEYAEYVIARAKSIQKEREWAVREVVRIGSDAIPTAARRPLNSRLDTARLQATFRVTLPSWRQGVDRMLCEVLDEWEC